MTAEITAGQDVATPWDMLIRRAHDREPRTTPWLWSSGATRGADHDWLLDLYGPLCTQRPLVVAHLGQSLDGRIATLNGRSKWITGPGDIRHNHRMRALFDAVLVGAGTIRHDDPRLTVREVPGPTPVRVIIDRGGTLGPDHRVFTDGAATTVVVVGMSKVNGAARRGYADVVPVEEGPDGLAPRAILKRLRDFGLERIFIEGGGVTVSRFLRAQCLDRLQLTIAPVIIGSGRPGLSLGEIDCIDRAIRPRVRRFDLGRDTLFECVFDDHA